MKEFKIHFPIVQNKTVTTCSVKRSLEKPDNEWYGTIRKKINELSYKKTLLHFLPTDIRMGGYAYPERSEQMPGKDFGESWTLAGLLLLLCQGNMHPASWLSQQVDILATGKINVELGKVYVSKVDLFQNKLEHFISNDSFSVFIVPSENLADIGKPFPEVKFLSLSELVKDRRKLRNRSGKTVISVGSSPDELELLISLFFNYGKKSERLKMPHLFTPFRIFLLSLLVIAGFIAGGIASVSLPEDSLEKKQSTVIYDNNGDILRVFISNKGHFVMPYQLDDEIPEKLKKAVLFFEDRQFYNHFGVNPFSVLRAFYQNISKGRKFSGASTITMQLARLMKEKDRSFSNKILETFQALKLEYKYKKEDILRKYLTFCPYGGNVYGYRTASIRYFRKEPDQLSWAESALLAILPNAPGLMHPEKNRDFLIKKRDKLLKRIFDAGIMDKDDYDQAVSEKVPRIAWPFDTGAWHATRYLKSKSHKHSIVTSLFKTSQNKTEKLLRSSGEAEVSLTNIAAVAVENKTGEVRIWVGSQDFFNDYINGQVDGVLARRPAAGMLQPFLYSLSIDKGLLLPDSLILDLPEKYKNYSPTNRDGKFLGKIPAGKALFEQRTVPAVRLLDVVGIEEFFTFLKVAGLKTLNYPPEWYSYSLVSGGTDVRLIDLAKLYSGLARYGKFSTLSLEGKRHKLPTDAKQLLTPKASWLTVEKMLKKEEHSDTKAVVSSTCTRRNKDCWVVAMTPRWTVAYWGGNLNGNSENEEKNLSYLTELTFETFSYLPKEDEGVWFENPEKTID